MDGLHVVEALPQGYSFEFEPVFYGTPSFQESNNALPQVHYYLVDNHYHKVFAHIAFSIEEGTAFSPVKAPFSGYEFSHRLSAEERMFFLIETERRLKVLGVEAIQVSQAPSFFNEQTEKQNADFEFMNYKSVAKRVYHSIAVNDVPLVDRMHDMERRKVRKSEQASLNFQVLEPSDLEKVFAFVKLQRDLKGYDFSMTWEQLRDAAALSPDKYVPAVMLADGRIAAATIAIRESQSVLYNFAPAHAPAFSEFSPVVALVNELYGWCKVQSVAWLNLGTSYLDDAPNKPLIQFKERLGAQAFSAFSLQKTLNS